MNAEVWEWHEAPVALMEQNNYGGLLYLGIPS